jgi:uncharacterized phage protein (TIGR01671 family)
MIREIKFRGKTADGEWYYGSLLQSEINVHGECDCQIHERFAHDFSIHEVDVLPTSVGQWTGLRDKNGKEVYEGDILEINWNDTRYHVKRTEVKWDNDSCSFPFPGGNPKYDAANHFEVIGNLFDNPELLNKEQGVHECDATKAQ